MIKVRGYGIVELLNNELDKIRNLFKTQKSSVFVVATKALDELISKRRRMKFLYNLIFVLKDFP